MPLNRVFMCVNDLKGEKLAFQRESAVRDSPAQSAVLSPIKNLWNYIKIKSGGKNNASHSFGEMLKVSSLPSRCEQVSKDNGYPTKY